MLPFDVRNFTNTQREQMAARVRVSPDFNLPKLRAWNYNLCREHREGWMEDYYDKETQEDKKRLVKTRPKPGCRKCAIHFRQHQRVSVAWLYLKKRALLADTMGSGKTSSAGGLIAMLKETGELGLTRDAVGRAIVIPRAPALIQWQMELARMMPSLNTVIATGTKAQRRELYQQDWEVLLISPQMLLKDNAELENFPLSLVVTDDVDTLRNPLNKQAYQIKRIGRRADRMVIMTGTPLQKRLPELHSVLDPIGGLQAFGSLDYFVKRHVTQNWVTEFDKRTGLPIGGKMVTSYRRLDEVKRKMAPMVLRRTAADLQDVTLPAIIPNDVWLDLYPLQQAKYQELQQGVLRILKEEGMEVKHLTALSAIGYGAKICGGLASLGEPDIPMSSSKMDWIMEKVSPDGELGEEKVVIFAQYKNSVRALQERFRNAGLGFETVWGESKSNAARMASQERFWTDPSCRFLIGTQSIEQSLNLQVSRHLINMDMIMNPARMDQLAGRIRRDGSAFQHVFVHNLLTVDTQEERYLPLLEREAALSSHIWDESSELFEALSPIALLQLIAG